MGNLEDIDKAEYKAKFEDAGDVLLELIERFDDPDYKMTARDISIAIEQGQKITDSYSEIIEEIDADTSGFQQYCKMLDRMEQTK